MLTDIVYISEIIKLFEYINILCMSKINKTKPNVNLIFL